MTIKQLKEKIKDLPDEMQVAINESASEATGMLHSVRVIKGYADENRPYDKGDDIWATNEVDEEDHVCFLNS